MSSFAAAGAIVMGVATVPYIVAVIKGSVRPRIVSWGAWAVLAGIMTVSAYFEGEMPSAVLSFVSLVSCLSVSILGWRNGIGRFTKIDKICLLGAFIGVISLLAFRDPLIAIIIALVVDAVAFVPTLMHAWQEPAEESLLCFSLSAIGGGLALFAAISADASLVGLLYPVYALAFNMVAALLIATGRISSLFERGYGNEKV